MAMTIDEFIGRLYVDDMAELLDKAWEVATEEQRRAFVDRHEGELEDMLPE